MADNLKIHQQINALLAQRTKVLDVHNDILKDQIALASTLRDALDGAEPEKLVDRFTEVREALNDVAKSSRQTGQSMDSDFRRGAEGIVEAKKETGGLLGTLKKVAKAPFTIAAAFLAGIADVAVKAVKLLWNTGKITLSTFAQLAESAWNIGSAIVSFPMRVFEGLLAMSDALAQAFLHIAQQWEAVRKEFGDPTEDVNRSIHGLVRNMRSFSGEVGSVTRLGLYSVFKDQAEAASYAAEVFGALGSTASILGGQIEELGMDFVVFQKGMGLSGEEMRALGERAITSGRPIQEVLHEVANMSLQLSEAFGYSGKLVSKDMGKMVKDVSRFGNLSVRRLGEVAVRARSLGLEVESLGKVVDKFLTFDDAAESAAKLAQAFGVNVDSMTLMREASNGGMGAIDELRRAFFEAGRDAEKMSLVQLRLLSQNTGLSEEEARLAFSMKNRGKSMEDISKQAGSAEKKELSQAEAMSKLADATERYIRFIDMSGGLFDRFAQGFARGVKHSDKFLSTMFSLRAVSQAVNQAGFELGKIFISSFKPISKVFDAIKEIYNPKKYKSLMAKVNSSFTTFFEDLSDPAKAAGATRKLMSGLKEALLESWKGPGMLDLILAVKDVMSAAGHAIAGFIPIMAEQFVSGLDTLGDVMEGNASPIDGATSMMEKVAGVMYDTVFAFVDPIITALADLWKKGTVQKALVKFLDRVIVMMNNWVANTSNESNPHTAELGKSLGNFIKAALDLAWRAGIKPGLQYLGQKLMEGMSAAWQKIKDVAREKINDFVASVKGWMATKWEEIKASIDQFFSMETMIAGAKIAGQALGAVLAAPFVAWDAMVAISSKIGAKIVLFFTEGLPNALMAIPEKLADLKLSFTNALDYLSKIFTFEAAGKIMKEFVKGLEEGMGPVADNPIISTMFGALKYLMGPKGLKIDSPSKFAEKMIGENIGLGLTRGVESSLGGFSDTMLDNMNLAATTDAVTLMKQNMETDIKAINKSLESVPDIELSAKISPTGNGLGINGDVLKIEAGPLNLNLHLTVTMEADQVAKVLVDKASMVGKNKI